MPEGWEVKRLKYVSTYNDEVLPETTDPDLLLNYVDISSVSLVDGIQNVERIEFEKAPSRARRIVREGDTVVSTVRTYLKAIAPIREPRKNMIVSTGFAVIRPSQTMNPDFLGYFVQSQGFIGEVVSKSTGVSYPAINPSDLVGITGIRPPIEEQTAIADFLDKKTAEIDGLIAKQEALLRLLAEQRTALITHAVTKGLNPNAPMKPSGIDWLGDVPEGWEVKRLKHIVSYIGSGKTPRGGAEVYKDEGVMILRSQNIYDDGLRLSNVAYVSPELEASQLNTRLKSKDVLLNITGASIGRSAIVPNDLPLANVNQHVCIFRSIQKVVLPQFLHAFFCSSIGKEQVLSNENGTSREGLNFQQAGQLLIALPPLADQKSILRFIDKEMNEKDKLAKYAREMVARLREYRTALITNAVTGKIMVTS